MRAQFIEILVVFFDDAIQELNDGTNATHAFIVFEELMDGEGNFFSRDSVGWNNFQFQQLKKFALGIHVQLRFSTFELGVHPLRYSNTYSY